MGSTSRNQTRNSCYNRRSTLGSNVISKVKKEDCKLTLLTKYLSDENKDGELISDAEYKQQKALFQADRKKLETELQGVGQSQDNWLDTAEKVFNFAAHATYWLEHGTLDERRTIAAAFGLNLTLENRLLRYDLLKPFELIKEAADTLKEDAKKVSPQERTVIADQSYYFDQQNPFWGG